MVALYLQGVDRHAGTSVAVAQGFQLWWGSLLPVFKQAHDFASFKEAELEHLSHFQMLFQGL